jgi:phosphoribosyl-AMP cyclohydrolase
MTEAGLMEKLDWKKSNGLIPVVVQDADSKAMLMVAYANKEALEKTLSTGFAHYWSRSRGKLWMKGETSGHTQKIVRVVADCDYDALLYVVEQKGPVCHTGENTCFHHEFEC